MPELPENFWVGWILSRRLQRSSGFPQLTNCPAAITSRQFYLLSLRRPKNSRVSGL